MSWVITLNVSCNSVKVYTSVMELGITLNIYRAALKVKTAVKAGGITFNHNRQALKVKTEVTAVGITYHDVDLAGRLGTALDPSQSDMRVVLYSNGQTHGVVRVEEVIGMIEVQREECRPLPPHFQQDERTWISGTTFFQERLVLILTPEWILGELGEVVSVGARPEVHSQL